MSTALKTSNNYYMFILGKKDICAKEKSMLTRSICADVAPAAGFRQVQGGW